MKNSDIAFETVTFAYDTRTVIDNITFSISESTTTATRGEIEAVAKKARCHDFILVLPNGYDTVIAEGRYKDFIEKINKFTVYSLE